MTTSPADDEDLSPFAREWLKGKKARDFDVLEHLGGRLLWPVMLQRRRAGPDRKPIWTEEPAYLQTLDPMDQLKAVEIATRLFDERGLKIADPRHAAAWAEVEMASHVALGLREAVDATGKPYPPGVVHPQKADLQTLLEQKQSGISGREIARLYELMQTFGGFEGAKLEKVDKELAIKIALAIAEVGNLSPLVAIAGQGQDSCVVYSMQILSSYLRPKSFDPLPESLTPEP